MVGERDQQDQGVEGRELLVRVRVRVTVRVRVRVRVRGKARARVRVRRRRAPSGALCLGAASEAPAWLG